MNIGVWKKWVPLEGLGVGYWTTTLSFLGEGSLEFILAGDREQQLVVRYEKSVLAYRVADESWREETLSQSSLSCPGPWTFFVIESSPYLSSYQPAAHGQRVTHFAFATIDLLIEVLALSAPRVEREVRALQGGRS